MSIVENGLHYADTHEWVRVDGDTATVGISDHAQALLGDLVYVELPEVGSEVSAKDEVAVVESVKAASDVYAPVSGKILEVNEALEEEPGLVNSVPYDGGWLYKVALQDSSEVSHLMSAGDYEEFVVEED